MLRRFGARFRAWPAAWPSPSGPPGRQRSPGSTARRRRVARSAMRSTVEAGGAAPYHARHSGPASVNLCAAAGRRARRGTDRRRLQARHLGGTAGTARGRVPGEPSAAVRRAVGLPPGGRGEKLPPQVGAAPADLGRSLPCHPAVLPLGGSRLPSTPRPGRQARRAEGAPLKLFVEKVVTAPLGLLEAARWPGLGPSVFGVRMGLRGVSSQSCCSRPDTGPETLAPAAQPCAGAEGLRCAECVRQHGLNWYAFQTQVPAFLLLRLLLSRQAVRMTQRASLGIGRFHE